MRLKNNTKPNFCRLTKICAISDSHQEARKTSAFLSRILSETKLDKNVLFLHGGDLFKGIYPKELERDCYIKLKEAKPDIEMVFTLGNNDFGFNKQSLDYLIETVKKFTQKGIHTVSANIFESNGKRPEWLKPYTVVNRDGDKTFVTGFCIDNINSSKLGLVPRKQIDVIDEIYDAILKEQPHNVVILNHDYLPSSRQLVKKCREKGIDIDLVIGGHDHDLVPPDTLLNIYHPMAFCDSMYKMNIQNSGGEKKLSGIEIIKSDDFPLNQIFAKEIEQYEKESHLLEDIVPYTLNLTKQYSKPCPLGSFLADEMMNVANADIAFVSTGFLMKSLEYRQNQSITKYLFQKTMVADTPVKTVELSISELKEVFDNALKTNGYGSSNPRFLQCSNNIKIEGQDNRKAGIWEVKQIYIDDEPLLDVNLKPLSNKKYKCVIDSYIAEGGQGFVTLQKTVKSNVLKDGNPAKINEILLNALMQAPKKYVAGSDYPSFKLIELS